MPCVCGRAFAQLVAKLRTYAIAAASVDGLRRLSRRAAAAASSLSRRIPAMSSRSSISPSGEGLAQLASSALEAPRGRPAAGVWRARPSDRTTSPSLASSSRIPATWASIGASHVWVSQIFFVTPSGHGWSAWSRRCLPSHHAGGPDRRTAGAAKRGREAGPGGPACGGPPPRVRDGHQLLDTRPQQVVDRWLAAPRRLAAVTLALDPAVVDRVLEDVVDRPVVHLADASELLDRHVARGVAGEQPSSLARSSQGPPRASADARSSAGTRAARSLPDPPAAGTSLRSPRGSASRAGGCTPRPRPPRGPSAPTRPRRTRGRARRRTGSTAPRAWRSWRALTAVRRSRAKRDT